MDLGGSNAFKSRLQHHSAVCEPLIYEVRARPSLLNSPCWCQHTGWGMCPACSPVTEIIDLLFHILQLVWLAVWPFKTSKLGGSSRILASPSGWLPQTWHREEMSTKKGLFTSVNVQ